MENNELARRELGGQSFIERLIENADGLEKIKEVGMVIIKSGFCPDHFKQSGDAVGAIMCIEAGKKLGLSWMQSLSDIYPVKGRIGIMGTAAKAVIFGSGVLESWKEFTEGEWPNSDYKHVTISKRKGLPDEFRTEFSVFDAQTAGLMGKDIYKKYGKRMIAWRDIGFHASDYYQDILKGMKTVEELNDYDGLVPGAPEKTIITTEKGVELEVKSTDKEHSGKTTSKVASKIPDNKFGEVKKDDIQEATVIEEKNYSSNFSEANNPVHAEKLAEIAEKESPFKAEKGSVEYLDGKEVSRDGEPVDGNDEKAPEEGKLTLEEMEKMDTEVLKKMVMDDMDMMEASEIIPGKNTNKKLREIIYAHQGNILADYVAPYLKEKDEAEAKAGNIPVNKDFDQEAKDRQIDAFLDDHPPKKEEKAETGGNKYNLEVPAYDKGEQRDFATTKTLYNRMVGVTPQITSVRYLEIAEKAGLLEKYRDKEIFCRDATVEEINLLLNTN